MFFLLARLFVSPCFSLFLCLFYLFVVWVFCCCCLLLLVFFFFGGGGCLFSCFCYWFSLQHRHQYRFAEHSTTRHTAFTFSTKTTGCRCNMMPHNSAKRQNNSGRSKQKQRQSDTASRHAYVWIVFRTRGACARTHDKTRPFPDVTGFSFFRRPGLDNGL